FSCLQEFYSGTGLKPRREGTRQGVCRNRLCEIALERCRQRERRKRGGRRDGVLQNFVHQVNERDRRGPVLPAQLDVPEIGPAVEKRVANVLPWEAGPVAEKTQDIDKISWWAVSGRTFLARAEVECPEERLPVGNRILGEVSLPRDIERRKRAHHS